VITTPTIGATFGQAARLLAEHLANHALPEPASLEVISKAQQSRITTQVYPLTLPKVAAELLAWADILTTVTVQAWRPPTGHRVHLSLASTLSGAVGPVELTVFGGTDHDPAAVGELAPGEHRVVTLDELRTWATTTSGADLEGPRR
jgi:hypothetical protein